MCDHLKSTRQKIDHYTQNFDQESNYLKVFGSILMNSILILIKSLTEFHALWHAFSGYGAYLTTLSLLDSYYENLLIKRFNKLSAKDSTNKLDENFKEKIKNKTRPVISKMFNIIYGLNTDYFISKSKI
jgi:hypothetical protein